MNFEKLKNFEPNQKMFCDCGEIATEHYTTEDGLSDFHFCEFCAYQNDENLYENLKKEDCFEKNNLQVDGYKNDSNGIEIAYNGTYFIFQNENLIDIYESKGYDDENIEIF